MDVQFDNETQKSTYNIRLKDSIALFTKNLFYTLFDEQHIREAELIKLKEQFLELTALLSIEYGEYIWSKYIAQLAITRIRLDLDALAAYKKDPAAKSLNEIYLAYPGFHAIGVYRLSRELHLLNVPIIPRMMSEYAHGITGTDIHPGADIGDSFFIDHATGIVIGETTIIGNNVTIFQGVTLGGIQVNKNLCNTKRHPTIEDHVTIYANATILGGDITIGANSTIGANVWITKSIKKNSIVTYQSEIKIKSKNDTF